MRKKTDRHRAVRSFAAVFWLPASHDETGVTILKYRREKFHLYPYLFILPTFILIFIFSYYAMFDGIYMSFTDYRVGHDMNFVGFANYSTLFSSDGAVFWTSFKNQVILTLFAVFHSVFWPLLTAELLFFVRNKKIATFTKSLFVVPMLVPGIVVTLIWRFLYNKNFGFNTILQKLGLTSLQHDWLNDKTTAMLCVIFMGFPFVSGLNFLIFHAGVNNIGQDLYEAAVIDGANNWQVAWRIHVPNIMGYVSVIATLALIGSLSGFGAIAATTNGGPGNASMIPAMLLYKVAFKDGKFGYASAMGTIIMIIILILTLLQRKLLNGKEED